MREEPTVKTTHILTLIFIAYIIIIYLSPLDAIITFTLRIYLLPIREYIYKTNIQYQYTIKLLF